MAFQPQTPFPKSRGDTVRSGDWNDLIGEVQRLDTVKVDRAGDAISGSLTVAVTLGVGVKEPAKIPLTVNTAAPDDAPLFSLGTLNNEDFLSIFGGRRGNQSPFVAWKRGDLRLGTANDVSGQGFAERMRITNAGNVGIGNDSPQEKLDVNGRIKAGALSIGPWPANRNYLFFGANTLDQTQAGNYALLQGSGAEAGKTFLNSPVDIRFRINNTDQLVLNTVGLFGAAIGPGSARLRIVVGRTQPNQWVQYSANGIYVDVATSSAGFTQTPYYFTSLLGNTNHWEVRGSSSIYSASPNGFRVYIYYDAITVSNATAMGWYINWIAVGL